MSLAMFGRTRDIKEAVTVYLDGVAVPAERGEPLAVALIAADKLALARSPKLHRPRGPACFRGGCDGCLARVDGVPNVMTCFQRANGGERVETQNVVGSRRSDLLRVTDWFFPQGIDHHHLMAGIPGVSDVMQSFARKLAGLGRLPAAVELKHPAARLTVDTVILGGGPAGLAVASRLSTAGCKVAIVDDGPALGGSLRSLDPKAIRVPEGVRVFGRTTAGGVFLGEVLAVGEAGATVISAPTLVFANGAHDPPLVAGNNDLPGVFSARALSLLAVAGVSPKGKTALVGEGPWAAELARHLGEDALVRVDPKELESVHGTGSVRAITVRTGDRARKIKVDAVAVATAPAPSFELAEQAGARVRYISGAGYAVDTDEKGRAGEGLWAIGECTGAPLDLEKFARDAEIVARDILNTRR